MLELFAWSWGGHGQITTAAIGLTISAMIQLRRIDLSTKLIELAKKVRSFKTTGGNFDGPQVVDLGSALKYLLNDLPQYVQEVDLHAGNSPIGGELLDSTGQVRHFMRSKENVTSNSAYNQSMTWIKTHLTNAWQKMSDATNKKYEWNQIFSSNVTDFYNGLSEMADALHTAEDSYSQGHVSRMRGNTNLICELHYWDKNNKKGDKSTGQLKHEEYDDPNRDENKTFAQAAKVTAGELIVCVISNLDQNSGTFASELEKILSRRFNYFGPYPLYL